MAECSDSSVGYPMPKGRSACGSFEAGSTRVYYFIETAVGRSMQSAALRLKAGITANRIHSSLSVFQDSRFIP